jgi:soluble lytic murein transglycosylase
VLFAAVGVSARANDASDRFDAVAAFDEGRYEDALRALDRAPPAADLAYLRVRTLAELGRYDEALAKSEKVPSEWPAAVARDLAELRVDWAARAGRCDAIKTASKSSERLNARCAFAAGDHAKVKQLLASAKDAEGRSLYVRALIALHEDALAMPLARSFYVEQPAHRDVDTIEKFLTEAGPIKLAPEESLRRAEAFLSARDPERAHAELEKVSAPKDKRLEAQIWHLRGESLFRTRKRYAESHRAFVRAVKLGSTTADYDAFHAARATSRAGDDRAAIRAYRAFALKYKTSKLTPDALYLAAWLGAREKLPSASEDLKAFIASKYAAQAPGLKRDAIWQLGIHAIEKKAPKEATKWLVDYERAVGTDQERARAIYWQGRAALLEKNLPRAKELFSRALHEDRLGYYSQLAARRLIALGDTAPQAFLDEPTPLPMPKLKGLPPEVQFYRELGLYTDAADAVSRFLGAEPDRAKRTAAMREAGEANRVFVAAEPLFERALEGPPDATRAWIWEALLPRPYVRLVAEQMSRQRLDPSLFYGHMQVESHYKPKAVSSADAIGLMQLLPETAATVAKGMGMHGTRSDLMRPHVNITLGAAYLAGLIEEYGGQYPLAIAAYNAGTLKVDEWTGRHEHELDLWVEAIPVEQTRNYVRRVITAWSRYHALSDPENPWELPLPAKVRLRAKH